jgi:hypothetical protein
VAYTETAARHEALIRKTIGMIQRMQGMAERASRVEQST